MDRITQHMLTSVVSYNLFSRVFLPGEIVRPFPALRMRRIESHTDLDIRPCSGYFAHSFAKWMILLSISACSTAVFTKIELAFSSRGSRVFKLTGREGLLSEP